MKQKRKGVKLKNRIIIAFLCIVIFPLVLAGLAFYFLTGYKTYSIAKKYGIEDLSYGSIYNNVLLLSQSIDIQMENVLADVKEDASCLDDPDYLNRVNERLQADSAYLVVRKGNAITYKGTEAVSDDVFREALPPYGHTLEETNGIYYQLEGSNLLKQADVQFQDGSTGSIFMIGTLEKLAPATKAWLFELILFVIFILIITTFMMSMWLYHGVMAPLVTLKKAAKNIRDGNLNFSVRGNGVQEMDELCEDFEEMRIRLQESMREKVQYDKESKELISNISHDLKTPVTTIKGYVEGIMDGVADTPEKRQKYLRTIYNKASDMDRLIDELTLYSKIDTNKIPYTFKKISVSAYFDDCIAELQMELEGRGIELAYFNYLKKDVIVIADAEQMKRVINNIIGNSIKYMDKPRGVINVRLRDAGDYVQVEIEDNGRGMKQNELTRIFDRFYRTDASRNSKRGGSGIGLSIVKKIIEDHEGKVWATSKEGVGTVLYFVLRKYQEENHEQNTDH